MTASQRLLPWAFIILGLGVFAFGARTWQFAFASMKWPSASGQVLESRITESESGEDTTYLPIVQYSYVVGGKQYSGDRISFVELSTSNRNHAKSAVEMYPRGKAVTVHYNPEDPQSSALEVGFQLSLLFLPAMGALFIYAGIFMNSRISADAQKPNS